MTCPGCSRLVRVVRSHKEALPDEKPVPVTCPACDASIRLIPRLVGRRVSCNTCGALLEVTLTLRKLDDSDAASQKHIRRELDHKEDHPKLEEPELPPIEGTEETLPIKPPPLPLPEDCNYIAELHNTADSDASGHGNLYDEPQEDLVFGLPEIAENPFPSNPPHWTAAEVGPQAHRSQLAGRAFREHEEEFELDFPESEKTPSQGPADMVSSPLTPHEATLALRDREIGAALRLIQSGGQVPEVDARTSGASSAAEVAFATADKTPPWRWPLVTAAASTCAMLVTLYYIMYVL